jgi:hypothetical protein
MKIRPVGAELFHVDRQADRHEDVTFRNFANAPRKEYRLFLMRIMKFVLFRTSAFRADGTASFAMPALFIFSLPFCSLASSGE